MADLKIRGTDPEQASGLRIVHRLAIVALIGILGTIIVSAASLFVFAQAKVNGPVYSRIKSANDLVADILPPPEYILEMHLVAYQSATTTDAEQRSKLAERLVQLRKDYDSRRSYWNDHLPTGPMRTALMETSFLPAQRYFQLVEAELIPALKAGQLDKAAALVHGPLETAYSEHRTGIDALVELANAEVTAGESLAARWEAGGFNAIIICLLVTVVVGASIAYIITRGIVQRIQAVSSPLAAMSTGEADLTQRLESSGQDEIAVLSRNFNRFVERIHGMVQKISGNATAVASSASGLSSVSTQTIQSVRTVQAKTTAMAAAAEEASTNTSTVATGMDEMSTSLSSVAAATEEMSATINEVATQTTKAKIISDNAMTEAATLRTRMSQLVTVAIEIGKVTETITSIAAQTNLLALNATIEAARAGAAGKGFAVVAGEIKGLANQTAKATEEIKAKISEVQGSVKVTTRDIEQITGVIHEVSEIVSSIAAAVEEQSVVTKDVATRVAQTASGVKESNDRVAQTAVATKTVASDTTETSIVINDMRRGGEHVQQSAGELARLAEQLKDLVGQFKIQPMTVPAN